MPPALEYNATLVERLDLTSALAVFKVRADAPLDGGRFLPGQYVTIGLNNEEKPALGSVRRPMSIASAPEEGETLELYVRWVAHPESDNPLTHLLWKVGSGARMFMRNKAVGKFTVADTVGEDDSRLRICVAAGTGLAPFLSMARSVHLGDPAARLDGWAILHGASYPADLGYRDEMVALARDAGLHYLATISRPKEAPDWTGDVGRVEDYFRADRIGELESHLGLGPGELRPDKAVIYICGLQGTIGETILRLVPRGFVPENRKLRRALQVADDAPASLFFEQYDTTPVIPIDDPAVMEPLRASLRAALGAALGG